MANDIRFSIGYDIDRASIAELTQSLRAIQSQADKASFSGKMTKELKEASDAAQKLQGLLSSAWNSKLGQLDLTKVNNGIKETYGSVGKLKSVLESSGSTGAAAYNKIASSVLSTNLQLKSTNKLLDNMATTMANTVKWGVTSSIFNNITGSIQKAYYFTKDLNSSLNDIRIVTDKSADSMEKFAKQANSAAKQLRASTTDYTDASLIYYQQGLSDSEVKARTETTLKTANVTKQSADVVSQELTSVWNGYKVSAQEAELYIDKMAAVATGTASDLQELATGMSKVASAANSMGVDVDQLNAQLATIVSVTRQAPESVGTALKTIYARMGDLQTSGEDEFGTTLGTVSSQMAQMGVQVVDEVGNLRKMGSVIEEVAGKWDGWTAAQKQAAAVAMAGKRQYNNLIALFDNWDMYSSALDMSAKSAGTLQKQQDIYMESTEAHLQTLKTEAEKTYEIMFDTDKVNGFADALTGALGILNNFLGGLGGAGSTLLGLGAIGAKVFKTQIGEGLGKSLDNMKAMALNKKDLANKDEWIAQGVAKGDVSSAGAEKEFMYAEKISAIRKSLSTEEYNDLTNMQHKIGLREEEIIILKDAQKIADSNLDKSEEELELIQEKTAKLRLQQKAEVKIFSNASDALDKSKKSKGDEAKVSALKALDLLTTSQFTKEEQLVKIKEIVAKIEKGGLDDAKSRLAIEEEIAQAITSQKVAMLKNETKIKKREKAQEFYENDGEQELLEKRVDQETDEEELRNFLDSKGNQKKISGMIEGLSTLAMTGTTVIGIFKTLGDESLSMEEKIGQVLTTLLIMLPMIVSSFASILTIGPGLAVVINSITVGIGGTAAATEGLGAALLSLWSTLVPFLPIILGIAVALGAVILASKKYVEEYNRAAIAAKEAAEETKKLKEAYQDLKTVSDDFKKSISDYEDAKKGLKDLKVGTDEYKSALEKANEQAKALIENHKLYGKFTYGENGLINIDKKALDKALKESSDKATQAEAAAYGAEIYSNQAKLISQATDVARRLERDESRAREDSLAVKDSGLATGGNAQKAAKLLEEKYPDSGVPAEHILSLAESISGIKDFSIMSADSLKETLSGMKEIPKDVLESLDFLITDSGINKTLLELVDSFISVKEANEYNASQILGTGTEEKYGSKIDKMATDSEGKINEALRSEIKNAFVGIGNSFAKPLSEAYEKIDQEKINAIDSNELLNSFAEKQGSEFQAKDDKDLALKYAEMLGKGDKSSLSYTEKDDKAVVANKKGEEVLSGVDYDVMRREIAKQLAMEKIKKRFIEESQGAQDKAAQNLDQLMANAKKAGDEYGVDFSSGLLTGIANKTKSFDFTSLIGQLNPEEFNEISSLSDEQILTMFGMTEEKLKTLGFKNGQLFVQNFRAAFSADKYDEGAYLENLNKIFETQAEGLGVNIEEFKAYKALLVETYPELQKNLKGLNETALANKRMEKGVKSLAKGWENFDEVMSSSTSTAEDISSILPEVNSGIQDILNLSKEDFELLPPDFAKKNWSLIQDVVNGVDGAIDKLRDKSGQEILVKATGVLNTSQLDADLLALNNKLAGFDQNKFSVGISLDKQMASNTYTDFKNMCQDIITQAGMTTQQAQAYFRSMGYNIEFSEEESVRTSSYKIPNIKLDTVTGLPLVDPAKPMIELEGVIKTPGTAIKMITPTGSYGGGVATKRTAPKSSTPSKKSDSGGGSKSKKETKKGGDEFDRYWTINKAIQASVNSLAKMDKLQSHLFGQELINSLKQSNILLEKQAKLYDQLYAMQRQEAAELQATLRGNNVSFDANGAISNYAQATANALAAYNQAVAKYNKGALTDEAFAISEQAYEDFKKNLDRYDKLYFSEMQETKDKLDDIREKELENNLKAWETNLTINLDLASAKRELNAFLKETSTNFKAVYSDLGKELSDILNNSKTYTGTGGSLTSDIQAIKEVKAEIARMSSGGSSNIFASISEAQEKLKELNKTLMSDGKDLFSLYEDSWKTFMDGIEQSADKFEEIINKFDRVNKELEFQGQLIEMIYGEEAYALMSKLYEGQAKSSLSQIDSLKEQQDLWFDLYKNAQEGSEEQKKYYENWTSAQDNLNGKIVDYIELLKKDYLNTINDVLKKLETSISNTSLDNVGTQWDRITEKTDKYLDSVEKLYQTQTLANKINTSIKEATRLEDQQKLQDLYDREIEALREKDKLTQYDLDAANARYDIALKEMALEDARNSKSTMKLTRGNDGNWSYQYVTDENDIASKQQELADAYDKLYDLGKDAYQSNLEALQSLQKNYLDSYKEILTNETLSQAEKEQQIAELQAYYFEQYKALAEENTQYRNDLATISSEILLNLYEQDVTNYQNMTDTEKALVDSLKEHTVNSYANLQDLISSNYDGIKDKAHTTMASTLEEWTSAAQALGDAWNKDDGSSVKVQISKANDQIAAATANYSKLVTEMANRVAKDFGPAGIQGAIIKVEDETQKLSGLTKDVVSEVVNNLSAYKNAVNQIADIWNSVEQSILNAISATQTFVSIAGGASSGGSTGGAASKPSSGAGTKVGDGILTNGDSATLKAGAKYYDDSNGMKVSGSKYAGIQGGVVIDKINGNSYGVHIKSADGRYTDLGWVRPSDLSGYATGGYTGEWNTGEGKLALLHSKELVLNSSDTENILSAVSTIREIAGISDSINQTIISSIGQALLRMAGLNPNTNYSTQESNNIGSDTYIINAEFPAANDVNSIKEAILSLPNLASQAANKNKK